MSMETFIGIILVVVCVATFLILGRQKKPAPQENPAQNENAILPDAQKQEEAKAAAFDVLGLSKPPISSQQQIVKEEPIELSQITKRITILERELRIIAAEQQRLGDAIKEIKKPAISFEKTKIIPEKKEGIEITEKKKENESIKAQSLKSLNEFMGKRKIAKPVEKKEIKEGIKEEAKEGESQSAEEVESL